MKSLVLLSGSILRLSFAVFLFFLPVLYIRAQEIPLEKRLVQHIGPTISVSDDDLDRLEKIDASTSMDEFLATVYVISPDGCPTIYSPWFCDRIMIQGDTKRAEHELRVRALGKVLLGYALNHTGDILAAGPDISAQQHNAEQFLNFAEWVAKGDGYGNGIIASRCRALAGIALAYIIVENGVTVGGRMRELIDMADAGGRRGWIESVIRAHEHEASNAIAPFIANTDAGVSIEQTFRNSAFRIAKLIKDKQQKDGLTKLGTTAESATILRRKLPLNLAIWVEDPFTGRSIQRLWDVYRFEHNEVHTKLMNSLRITCLFLDEIKGFPIIVAQEQLDANDRKLLASGFYRTPTEVAFYRAWEEFAQRKEFLQSNVKTDHTTGRVHIDPNAEDLTAKYLNTHAGSITASIYDNVKLGRMRSYLMGDDTPGK